jgi:hypothetical protein
VKIGDFFVTVTGNSVLRALPGMKDGAIVSNSATSTSWISGPRQGAVRSVRPFVENSVPDGRGSCWASGYQSGGGGGSGVRHGHELRVRLSALNPPPTQGLNQHLPIPKRRRGGAAGLGPRRLHTLTPSRRLPRLLGPGHPGSAPCGLWPFPIRRKFQILGLCFLSIGIRARSLPDARDGGRASGTGGPESGGVLGARGGVGRGGPHRGAWAIPAPSPGAEPVDAPGGDRGPVGRALALVSARISFTSHGRNRPFGSWAVGPFRPAFCGSEASLLGTAHDLAVSRSPRLVAPGRPLSVRIRPRGKPVGRAAKEVEDQADLLPEARRRACRRGRGRPRAGRRSQAEPESPAHRGAEEGRAGRRDSFRCPPRTEADAAGAGRRGDRRRGVRSRKPAVRGGAQPGSRCGAAAALRHRPPGPHEADGVAIREASRSLPRSSGRSPTSTSRKVSVHRAPSSHSSSTSPHPA